MLKLSLSSVDNGDYIRRVGRGWNKCFLYVEFQMDGVFTVSFI